MTSDAKSGCKPIGRRVANEARSGLTAHEGRSYVAPSAIFMPRIQNETVAALCLLAVVALGCAQPVKRRDWSAYDGPGAAAFERGTFPPPMVDDPLEPPNRAVWGVNHFFIEWVASPVGRAYRFVTPRLLRDRVRDFARNLEFPRNFVANLLQGEAGGAARETGRFLVNTTVGVAGLWDPATYWLHIAPAEEDFGQVFARWGWRHSTYLTLPIFGPSTVRDGIGMIPDAALDPAQLFFPAAPAFKFNDLVDSLDEYERFSASSFDVYDDARLLATFAREVQIEEPSWDAPSEDTGAVQTLGATLLVPQDEDFANQLSTGFVSVPGNGRALPYSYRIQEEAAPLVLIVPGLGAHRLSGPVVALAEMAWDRGCSVAILSSTMNAEFIANGGSIPVPGHAPTDARDVHLALDAMNRDLSRRFPGRVERRVYLGYSLGALHGFHVAAAERTRDDGLVRFDDYVLIDPPVKLVAGMEHLDAFAAVPRALPEAERDAEARRILLKGVSVGKRALAAQTGAEIFSRYDVDSYEESPAPADQPLPFTNAEAEYLVGFAFQRSLKAVLYASQEREDLGILLTERRPYRRNPPYEEIGDYSFAMYFYGFVLPYHRDRLGTVATAEEMIEANDLRAIGEGLRDDPKLHVFANENDFLTSDEDLVWLRTTVGPERVRIFPSGGHLGNLHRPEVQAEILAPLGAARPAASSAP